MPDKLEIFKNVQSSFHKRLQFRVYVYLCPILVSNVDHRVLHTFCVAHSTFRCASILGSYGPLLSWVPQQLLSSEGVLGHKCGAFFLFSFISGSTSTRDIGCRLLTLLTETPFFCRCIKYFLWMYPRIDVSSITGSARWHFSWYVVNICVLLAQDINYLSIYVYFLILISWLLPFLTDLHINGLMDLSVINPLITLMDLHFVTAYCL